MESSSSLLILSSLSLQKYSMRPSYTLIILPLYPNSCDPTNLNTYCWDNNPAILPGIISLVSLITDCKGLVPLPSMWYASKAFQWVIFFFKLYLVKNASNHFTVQPFQFSKHNISMLWCEPWHTNAFLWGYMWCEMYMKKWQFPPYEQISNYHDSFNWWSWEMIFTLEIAYIALIFD